MGRAWCGVIGVVAGCFDPSPHAGTTCSPDGLCPAPLTCYAGTCWLDPPGAPDAPPIDATAPIPDGPATAPDAVVDEPPTWDQVVVGTVDNMIIASVTSPAIGGVPGQLYLAVLSVKPSRSVTSVAGLGLTWSLIKQQCGGRDTARVAMFWALGPAASTGAVTATLNGGMPFLGSAVIAVHRYKGANLAMPIGAVVSANTNGVDMAAVCSGGTDSNAYSFSTLDTGAASSRVVVGVHRATYLHAPGMGYTERSDDASGATASSAGLAVEDRAVPDPTIDVPVTGSFAGSPDWAVIAIEVRD